MWTCLHQHRKNIPERIDKLVSGKFMSGLKFNFHLLDEVSNKTLIYCRTKNNWQQWVAGLFRSRKQYNPGHFQRKLPLDAEHLRLGEICFQPTAEWRAIVSFATFINKIYHPYKKPTRKYYSMVRHLPITIWDMMGGRWVYPQLLDA